VAVAFRDSIVVPRVVVVMVKVNNVVEAVVEVVADAVALVTVIVSVVAVAVVAVVSVAAEGATPPDTYDGALLAIPGTPKSSLTIMATKLAKSPLEASELSNAFALARIEL
jgi:BarA-like signal transduction histidine kinase